MPNCDRLNPGSAVFTGMYTSSRLKVARASLTIDGLMVQSQDTEFVWLGRLKYFPVSPDPWSNG